MSLLIAALFWIGLAVAVGVASGVAATVGYLFGRLARGWTDETAARWTNVLAIVAAAVGGIAVWIVVDAGGAVDGTLVPEQGLLSTLIAVVVGGAAAGIVGTGAIAGMLRGRPALPGVEDPSATRRQYTRYLTALFLVAFGLVSAISPALQSGPLAIVGVVALLIVGLWAVAPVVSLLASSTREPTDSERERLEQLLETAAVDVRGVRIVDGDGRVSLELSGAPGGRYLFVSAGALSGLEDETLEAMLVARREQAARLESLATTVPIVAGLLVLAVALTTDVSLAIGLVGGVAVVLVGVALTRRLRYYTDARASDDVGSDRLADAFERACDVAGVDLEESGGRSLLTPKPSISARIERLRNADESDYSTN